MGHERSVAPVKLIASLLTAHPVLLGGVREGLCGLFGPTDVESELLPFDHTDYYASEFGAGLQRQVVAFRRLIAPADLPSIKRQTNEIEQAWAEQGRRRVNVDPGYVGLGKLVLASTKDHAHRLYLGEGIYGEVTLTYQGGRFRSWPWTYPDYGSERYCCLFARIRELYKAQLKELRE